MPVAEPTPSKPTPETNAIRRVLVVDDSLLQRKILSSLLCKWGFEVLQAESGIEALEICKTSMPDVILSDWMMPGMDGLEFCKAFRSLDNDAYGYFILLTSKSEKAEVAKGLDAGADDFLTKPVNGDELRARITAGGRILVMERELQAKNQLIGETLDELRRAHDAINQDLIQARKIQQSLVPRLAGEFGKSQVSLLLKPCGHVGGDLVGMFSPGDSQLGFYCIDVSGHGITSAMMTARVAGYLNSDYPDQNIAMERRFEKFLSLRPPETVAKLLNDRLVADVGIEEYFTMVYATIDLKTGTTKMVQAGHPHPLILRADGSAEFMGDGGLPIGLVPDASFQGFQTVLKDQDRLLLYSDGFTECIMKNGEMLEPEGFVDLVQKCTPTTDGQEFLNELFWRLNQERDPTEMFDDDVSAALLEFCSSGPPHSVSVIARP